MRPAVVRLLDFLLLCQLAVLLLARGDTPAGDTIFYFTLLGTFHNRSSIGKNKCYCFTIRPKRLFFQEGL